MNDWKTRAEATDYRQTARYDETVAYARRLDEASPFVQLQLLGSSPEGRGIPVLVVSKDKAFTPEAARASGKEILLVNAGIHSGEIEGKDAGFALIRDMVITGEQQALLDRAILVFIPIFSVDAHERFGPYNRINQNGPSEMGWRSTAQNYNLNRDFLKADSPEMRIWLDLFRRWLPDLVVDVHTTDGADYQYNLTYGLEPPVNQHPQLAEWQKRAFGGEIFPAMKRRGNLVAPYLTFRDEKDLTKGFEDTASQPRYSTGYGAIQNRPTLLVETHMLKDYRNRVRSTYDLLAEILAYLGRHPGELRRAVTAADNETIARGKIYDPARRFPLSFQLTERAQPFEFAGFASTLQPSAISGSPWIRYDPSKPQTFSIPFFNDFTVETAIAPPLAYIVPVSMTGVIERLAIHGVRTEVLSEPRTLKVQTYRFSDVQWAKQPFEGHHPIEHWKITPVEETIAYPAGSVLVPLDQRTANVAIHLLEPQGPDSLVHWGYMDGIFQQKEYGEAYVVEQLAREMLAKDPQLKTEFEARLTSDKVFAASPEARLDFFYRRSPYWDMELNRYPIGRVVEPVSHP